MITTKRSGTDDYTQVGFIEAKDNQGNYQNIDKIYDNQGNIVFQQGYLNEYEGADNISIPAIGKPLIDYTIYGNTVQNGTPTPDIPVDVAGCGAKTENLFDIDNVIKNYYLKNGVPTQFNSGRYVLSDYIPIASDTATISAKITISSFFGAHWAVYDENKTFIRGGIAFDAYGSGIKVRDVNTSGAAFIRVDYSMEYLTDCMLNLGSTPLPYEPYGYKIPISSAGQTKNIYLGQVPTTRKIKKLVLTGEEDIYRSKLYSNAFVYENSNISTAITRVFSTHFEGSDTVPTGAQRQKKVFVTNSPGYIYHAIAFGDWQFSGDATAFKSWLAQQYAAGTPVTMWYVLATETTGIVNEPLMKIDDYADSITFEQAGVEIPTLKKPNTTVIDVETEVEPSEVDVKYRGLIKPKYDLFLAQNGDSLEAKDGQSLYIGGYE